MAFFNMRSFMRENYATIVLLFFISIFYSFLILNGREKMEALLPLYSKQIVSMSLEETQKKEEDFTKNLQANPELLGRLYLVGTVLLSVSLFLNGCLLSRKLRKKPFLVSGIMESSEWGVKDAFFVFVFLFFAEACIAAAEIATFYLGGFRVPRDNIVLFNALLRNLATLFLIMYLVRVKFRQKISSLGLTTVNFFRNIFLGIAAYVTIVPWLVLVLFVVSLVTHLISYEPLPQPVVEMYFREMTGKYFIYLTFFVAALGPFVEEVFFRGFAYKAFRVKSGVRIAAVASSLLFAVLHWNLIALLPIFLLGLFLTYLYEKTGSLVPSITVHVLHNLIMVGLTLGFKTLAAQ